MSLGRCRRALKERVSEIKKAGKTVFATRVQMERSLTCELGVLLPEVLGAGGHSETRRLRIVGRRRAVIDPVTETTSWCLCYRSSRPPDRSCQDLRPVLVPVVLARDPAHHRWARPGRLVLRRAGRPVVRMRRRGRPNWRWLPLSQATFCLFFWCSCWYTLSVVFASFRGD